MPSPEVRAQQIEATLRELRRVWLSEPNTRFAPLVERVTANGGFIPTDVTDRHVFNALKSTRPHQQVPTQPCSHCGS